MQGNIFRLHGKGLRVLCVKLAGRVKELGGKDDNQKFFNESDWNLIQFTQAQHSSYCQMINPGNHVWYMTSRWWSQSYMIKKRDLLCLSMIILATCQYLTCHVSYIRLAKWLVTFGPMSHFLCENQFLLAIPVTYRWSKGIFYSTSHRSDMTRHLMAMFNYMTM